MLPISIVPSRASVKKCNHRKNVKFTASHAGERCGPSSCTRLLRKSNFTFYLIVISEMPSLCTSSVLLYVSLSSWCVQLAPTPQTVPRGIETLRATRKIEVMKKIPRMRPREASRAGVRPPSAYSPKGIGEILTMTHGGTPHGPKLEGSCFQG